MAVLFNITHDANNLNEYDSTVTDGGDLSTGAPGLAGTTAKMEALINDTTEISGRKGQACPAGNQIRLRMYIDPNGIAMDDTEKFAVCTAIIEWDVVFAVFVEYDTDHYVIEVDARNDGGGTSFLDTATLSDDVHYIELHEIRATNAASNDGTFQWWLDGVDQGISGGFDNFDRFGALAHIDFGAKSFTGTPLGTIYLDEFKANDDGSEIGPVAAVAIPRHPATIFQCPAIV